MKINKYELGCYYCISKYINHNIYKNNLLKFIDIAQYTNPQNEVCELNITKTDWSDSRNFSRPWLGVIFKDLKNSVSEIFKSLNYDEITIKEMWFQQYHTGSEHGWHTHGCNFTGVYYVELPDDSPQTLIIEPFTNKEITLDVKEGDIVIFPSFTIHKAPKNMSDKRKTIVSFNLNTQINYDKKYSLLVK